MLVLMQKKTRNSRACWALLLHIVLAHCGNIQLIRKGVRASPLRLQTSQTVHHKQSQIASQSCVKPDCQCKISITTIRLPSNDSRLCDLKGQKQCRDVTSPDYDHSWAVLTRPGTEATIMDQNLTALTDGLCHVYYRSSATRGRGIRGSRTMASPLQFAEDDFMIHIEDLEIGPKIGEGQFSTVCLGRYIGKLRSEDS